MSEVEWLTCDRPFDMLRFLDGKVPSEAFIPFNVACCRRIWPLIPDPRARAVVEATGAAVERTIEWEGVEPAYETWYRAWSEGEIEDRAGGITNEAIESVCGIGHGHAAQVSSSCFQAAGYAASEMLRASDALQFAVSAAWSEAEFGERVAQCGLLRDMFNYSVGLVGSPPKRFQPD